MDFATAVKHFNICLSSQLVRVCSRYIVTTPKDNESTSAMADANAPKPSSSVKLVLLGEAAVGKVRKFNLDSGW